MTIGAKFLKYCFPEREKIANASILASYTVFALEAAGNAKKGGGEEESGKHFSDPLILK